MKKEIKIKNEFKLNIEYGKDKSDFNLPIFSYIYESKKFVKIYEIVEYYSIAYITVSRHLKIIRHSIIKYKLPYEYIKSKNGIKIIKKAV